MIDAELNGPTATITVKFDPSKTNIKAIAEMARSSLDSDHSAAMRGSMAEIEYLSAK